MNMDIKDSIKDEIAYCEKKAIEYAEDVKQRTGGKIDLWRGKSEVHQYMAVRLTRLLEFYEQKSKN